MLICCVLAAPVNMSCSKYSMMKREEKQRRKQQAKDQEQKELEAQAAYEQAVERHYAMQTKSTKKAMRQNMKKSIALKENKKPSFLKRWFTPKQKRTKPNRRG